MDITPFRKVASREILGADITGLAAAINKLEEIIGMSTASATDHTLVPVIDQPDTARRRRIYEGTIRGWLETPVPIIKRNGNVVSELEYTLLAAQGAVVFNEQQDPAANITADFTHIIADSLLKNHVGSGGNSHALASAEQAGFMAAADYSKLAVLDATLDLNVARFRKIGRYHVGLTATDLLTGAVSVNTMDFIPFYVPVTQTFNRIAIAVTVAGAAGSQARLGVYADSGDVYPGALLVDAGEVTTDVLGERSLAVSLVLTPGLYWTANLFSGTPTIRLVAGSALIPLGVDITTATFDTGFRAAQAYAPLPNPAPTGMSILMSGRRAVFLRRSG